MSARVLIVPCLRDNYAYLVGAAGSDEVVVVDPSEPGPVLTALAEHGLRLSGVLATHHHFDHVGGIEGLRAALGELPVYGHESEGARIPGLSRPLADGQDFTAGGVTLRALHVPGHTLGALAFHGEGLVFTGDTLFLAGCGRMFEGTPEQMHRSLAILAALPPETLIYPGHEYTESNLRFAAHVEPESDAVALRAGQVAALRAAGAPSVPGTVAEELATNPFLRVQAPAVEQHLQGQGHDARALPGPDRFGLLRREKDGF